MSEIRSVSGILEVIKSITSNRESGRLEIVSSSTRGTLLFREGKLVDARLGSLSGFQAVNATVALQDVQISFDHITPAQQLSSITPSERAVLKSFFGIEAAEMNKPTGTAETDIQWNPAPEPVVPLSEAATIPLGLFSVPRLALCLVLLMGLTGGAIALRGRLKAQLLSRPVTTAVESQPSPVTEPEPEVKHVASEVDEPTSKVSDLTGEWQVINTIQKTDYKSFDNMKIGFRLKIDQQGKEFTGKGEKFSENGQTLAVENRTPIHVIGSIKGDKVLATFVEDGKLRKTNGRFVWKLQSTDQLAGKFVTTAANSSGRSAVTKQQ
jgi:hypothetical protein